MVNICEGEMCVGRHGGKKWSLIATLLNGRLGKQCRERCEWSIYVRVKGVNGQYV